MSTLNDPRLSKLESKAGQLQRHAWEAAAGARSRGCAAHVEPLCVDELEHLGVVRKSRKREGRRLRGFPAGRAATLIDATLQLRERGVAPWWRIVDDTRHLYSWESAPSVAAYLMRQLPRARIHCSARNRPRCCSASRARSAGSCTERWPRSTCAPSRRRTVRSVASSATDIAPELVVSDRTRRVLYVGDLDLSGGQIEVNTRRVLERELGVELDWTRIALTDKRARHRLEPMLKLDDRYADGHAHEAIEVESLGQSVVTEIVRAELDALLPEPLDRVLEREAEQGRALPQPSSRRGGRDRPAHHRRGRRRPRRVTDHP